MFYTKTNYWQQCCKTVRPTAEVRKSVLCGKHPEYHRRARIMTEVSRFTVVNALDMKLTISLLLFMNIAEKLRYKIKHGRNNFK
jgi:hypothetical protein